MLPGVGVPEHGAGGLNVSVKPEAGKFVDVLNELALVLSVPGAEGEAKLVNTRLLKSAVVVPLKPICLFVTPV